MNRDSIVLWLGFFGGLAGFISANLGVFPVKWQGTIATVCGLIMALSGWLKSSPLAGSKTDPARVATVLGIQFTKEP